MGGLAGKGRASAESRREKKASMYLAELYLPSKPMRLFMMTPNVANNRPA